MQDGAIPAKYKLLMTMVIDALVAASMPDGLSFSADADRATLSPHIERETSWEDNPDKEWDARAMAVHAAMIDRVDQGLGKLVAKLEELEVDERTAG